jgi:hypothetical protein
LALWGQARWNDGSRYNEATPTITHMSIHHVSLGFAEFGDTPLDEFAADVVIKLTGNAPFAAAPSGTTLLLLGASQVTFHNAISATTQGGSMATAAKNLAREALIDLLRQWANFVQGIAKNNLPLLLSSGFRTTSPSTAQTPLAAPSIVAITNPESTKLAIELSYDKHTKSLEVQGGIAGTPPVHMGTFQTGRKIIVPDLTPGSVYSLQIRGVGGSTDHSGWSDAVTHMCT